MDLPTTVAPFILRGITLTGIDSVMAPRERRLSAWAQLAEDLDRRKLHSVAQEVTLAGALLAAPTLLAGAIRGRVVVNVNT